MALPQEDRPAREPVLFAPPVVLWLIAAILLAHAVRVELPGFWPERIILEFALIPARFAITAIEGWPLGALPGLLVTLVSYIFLHGDLTHVGVNSLWLLAFGPVVARRLGTARFLSYFFLCGVAAAGVHLSAYWDSPAAVVGASGGVSGLMGGAMRIVYGRLYVLGRGELAPILSRSILVFSLVWMAVNVVSGIFRLGIMDDLTLVAWVAHLGGYFAGLFMIGIFDPYSCARGKIHPV